MERAYLVSKHGPSEIDERAGWRWRRLRMPAPPVGDAIEPSIQSFEDIKFAEWVFVGTLVGVIPLLNGTASRLAFIRHHALNTSLIALQVDETTKTNACPARQG